MRGAPEVVLDGVAPRLQRRTAQRPMALLHAPLLAKHAIPLAYRTDRREIAATTQAPRDKEVDALTAEIPYASPGPIWLVDRHGLNWSLQGIHWLRIRLFWASLEQLTLRHNEAEKWSVLKWIFRPAIHRHYVFDRRKGHSLCLVTHENDEPFSFHNCCLAVGMDEDILRAGIRRNLPAQLIEAVTRLNA